MRYHDLRIRDAGRLAAMAAGLIAVVTGCMLFREEVEPIFNLLSSARSREPFLPIMAAFSFLAALFGGAAIHMLSTSPADNADHLCRMAAKGRPLEANSDPSMLDPDDPDFNITTWAYLKRRRQGR